MGKDRDRESLIRLLVNVIVHKIVLKNTNKPESEHFLSSEIIEYRGQTEKVAEQHCWSESDKDYIREKILKKIKEKMENKYSDVNFSMKDVEMLVDSEMKEVFG